jgi:hypothetical protein
MSVSEPGIDARVPPGSSQLQPFLTAAERLAPWIVAVVVVEIVAVAVVHAFYDPLWLDEIIGVFTAKLPSTSDIWAICSSGAEYQPPFYHYLTRGSISLFGNDALGLRIPSILGYVLFCLSLYWFVGRRTSRLYALIAMLFPGVTKCWYFATNGRPYALVLACAGLAAVCWQFVIVQQRRWVALSGLALALACSLSLHYYSVLLLLPFWAAEAVRTFMRRKADIPVWFALLSPLLVLIVLFPVIRVSRVNSGIPYAFFAKPSLGQTFWNFVQEFLGPSLVGLILIGIVYLLVQIFRTSGPGVSQIDVAGRHAMIPEAVLVLGFTCLPLFAVFLSRFVTHIFFSRYAIAGNFGFAALLALCVWLAFGGNKAAALTLASVLALLVLHDQIQQDFRPLSAQRAYPPNVAIMHRLPQATKQDSLPIVMTNLDDYMRFFYYGRSRFRERLFYVSSEAVAEKYLGFTLLERMAIASAPFFGTQVVDYASFIKDHKTFYVFGPLEYDACCASAGVSAGAEAVVPKLLADGADLQLVQAGPVDTSGDFATTCLRANLDGR